MKNIAKQTVLFGALALLSSISLQAMETAPADVQEEVAVKQGFFRGLTKDAREFKLKNLMKELDAGWKPFMRCVKKGSQDCSAEARSVRRLLASIMALVGVGVLIARGRRTARWLGIGQREAAPAAAATETGEVTGVPEQPRLLLIATRYAQNPSEEMATFSREINLTSDTQILDGALQALIDAGIDETDFMYKKLANKIRG